MKELLLVLIGGLCAMIGGALSGWINQIPDADSGDIHEFRGRHA